MVNRWIILALVAQRIIYPIDTLML